MLLMIGWKGQPGIKDKPEHKKQGRVTIKMLKTMEVPYQILSADKTDAQADEIIKTATKEALKNNESYAIVVKKDSFSKNRVNENKIVKNLDDNDIIISTTGATSRELFEYREELKQGHENDFLTVGGMGHANQIALGIAIQKPNRRVFCFDGDGAILMHMGSLAINGSIKCKNLKHIVFNNGAHDSVGGQPTVGFNVDLQSIAKACGYNLVMEAKTNEEIKKCLDKLKKFDDKVFLEIKVKKGFRGELSRPTTLPKKNKQCLMKFIKK
jgi:phosphonopyruvate decarboxylase